MKDRVFMLTERPAAAGPPSPAKGGKAAAESAKSDWLNWHGSGGVLVVDDEDAVRLAVACAVTRLGFTANGASNGAQAISLFKSDPGGYALVLIDLTMPGIDAVEIIRNLRLARPEIPVVVMSGLGTQEALARTSGMRTSGILHKPFTMEELASLLRAVLGA
jgi:DNA-binding response OmpR family regulator